MAAVFLDTAHLLAVLRPRDELHDVAMRLARELQAESTEFVTTTLVLAEVLAGVARQGSWLRDQGASTVRDLREQPNVTVVDLTPDLFERALALYEQRRDKSYSLADCASMVVCHDLGITRVATADADFAQEGFSILL